MPKGLPRFALRMEPLGKPVRARWTKGAGTGLAAAFVLLLGLSAANAQENPDSFTLPEGRPSPTPTPTPQGPEDERGGVPIAPRLIDPARGQPAPERTPTPVPPAREQAPTPNPAAAPSEGQPTPPPSFLEGGIDEPFEQEPTTETTSQEAGSRTALQDSPRGAADLGRIAPTSTSTTITPALNPSVSEADAEWVDVSPDSIDALDPTARLLPTADKPGAGQFSYPAFSTWVFLGAALLVLGAIGWILMRARRFEETEDGSAFTTGARREMGSAFTIDDRERSGTKTGSPTQPLGLQMDTLKATLEAEPKPSPSAPMGMASAPRHSQPETPRASVAHTTGEGPSLPLAISLSITSARRSVMMFTLEYRVDLANRGDKPVRDLTLSGALTCAQAGASQDGVGAPNHVLGHIDRIGPQQTRAITGTLEMPLANVRLIRQGTASVFIPLMIVKVDSEGWSDLVSRFVIGTPSPANASRLQPIVFDTRIGGLGTLRADKIQPFPAPTPSSAPAKSSAVS